jgi:hypothetical protein
MGLSTLEFLHEALLGKSSLTDAIHYALSKALYKATKNLFNLSESSLNIPALALTSYGRKAGQTTLEEA